MNPSDDLLSENLFSLKGKIALITGGGSGIGKMIAKGFVQNGCRVYIASRRKELLKKIAEELNCLRGSGECIPIEVDLNSKASCEKLATEIGKRENGKLDILVNNSGMGLDTTLTDIPEISWDKILKLNVISVFYLTIACLPLLEKASHKPSDPSRVIVIGSISGIAEGDFRGIVEATKVTSLPYNVSKAAVHNVAMNLAVNLTPRGINVNVIAPGIMITPMTNQIDIPSCTLEVPQGRLGNEMDMVGASLYLASRAGSWVSGVVIPVDGGTILRNKEWGMSLAKL
ncbi:7882_t:CDS:2 [Diversispora eburnea]|uniref:7882_t:CDS:1 n=1 Tax=Diversispora eburnea TaxID=1213867 RepID=A0A9N8WGZ9_9GLOM|nr:7882_t:CDS:2 [Diversispora eburnea]